MPGTPKLRKISFLYACIFAVSLFYRFYALERRGYFPGSDAPVYAGIVKTYRAGLDYIVRSSILKQDIGTLNDYLYDKGGQFGSAAKDGLIPIGLMGSFIFGDSPSSILYTSAIFGAATVGLLFYILSQIISPLPSFLLTLLFAVSPYHIGFSREGLTVTFSSFFLLAGAYFYIRSLKSDNSRYPLFCGLSLGFGFLCHYNIAPFILVFFAFEACRFISKKTPALRAALISAFAFLPLLLMDFSGRVIKLYGKSQQVKLIDNFNPYFNELFRQLIIVKEGGSDIHAGPYYYFTNLLYHEGVIPSLLLIAALVFIALKTFRADNGEGYFLVALFLAPFAYFLWMMHSIGDRQMLNFIPLWYLLIGYGLSGLTRYGRLFAFTIMIAVILNGYRSLDYFNYRSNFEEAVGYMRRNKGVKHVSSVMPLSKLYAGRKNAESHAEPPFSEELTASRKIVYQIAPVSKEAVESLYKEGYKYLLLNIPPSVSNGLTTAAIAIQPDFSTPDMICNDRGDGYDPALLRDKKGRYLYHFNVYDLSKVLNSMGEPSAGSFRNK